MKKTLLALALTGTFGVASAQGLNTGMPATKPVVSTNPAAAVTAPVDANTNKGDPNINPFNGKLQSAEQIQRELEQARVQTQMLEERLKQTNLTEELKTVPMRKAVEAAQAATAVKKEEASQKEIEAAMRAPKVSPAATARAASVQAAKPVSVKKPRATVRPADKEPVNASQEPAKAAAPVMPRPTLVSVMAVGNSRSAVLEVAGGTMVVAEGESTPFGVLKIRDKDTVELGGSVVRVHNATIARFVVSDAKAVAQPGSNNQGGPAAVSTPLPVPPVAPAPVVNATTALPAQANGPLPALPLPPGTPAAAAQSAGIGPKAQMPTLQLPPGVNVLPPSM